MNKMPSPIQVCRIIKDCAKLNVSRIRYGDLELEFFPRNKEEPQWEVRGPAPKEETQTATEGQTRSITRDELDRLAIEDPSAYESAVIEALTDGDGAD